MGQISQADIKAKIKELLTQEIDEIDEAGVVEEALEAVCEENDVSEEFVAPSHETYANEVVESFISKMLDSLEAPE